MGKIAIKRGIPTLLRYFNKITANFVLKKYGKAKIITATNVFAHIDNIDDLMRNILKLIKEDGVFITESHYLLDIEQTLQFDSIYHEHLKSYSVKDLVSSKELANAYSTSEASVVTHCNNFCLPKILLLLSSLDLYLYLFFDSLFSKIC